MDTPLRTTHIIEAALKGKGAYPAFIATFLTHLETLAQTPEQFRKWNRTLDTDGIKTLSLMLTPAGAPLCDIALQHIFTDITTHFGITTQELRARAGLN